MDFTRFPTSDVLYGGSEEKIGLMVDGVHYLIKFQKKSETGWMNNHVCEHIGSGVFALFGELVQNTSLGTYGGRQVVACMDFVRADEQFVPFNEVGDSGLERDHDSYQYTYDDIVAMLEENRRITNVRETVEKFWDLYVYDALLGNFDRHGANWGFIKKDGGYRMAPIFDNGSCLFPRIATEEQCLKIIDDVHELDERTFRFPTSQIKLGNRKSSYYDVISSLRYDECNRALVRVHDRLDLARIDRFITSIEGLGDIQKKFYRTIIRHRHARIIEASYRRLVGERHV